MNGWEDGHVPAMVTFRWRDSILQSQQLLAVSGKCDSAPVHPNRGPWCQALVSGVWMVGGRLFS